MKVWKEKLVATLSYAVALLCVIFLAFNLRSPPHYMLVIPAIAFFVLGGDIRDRGFGGIMQWIRERTIWEMLIIAASYLIVLASLFILLDNPYGINYWLIVPIIVFGIIGEEVRQYGFKSFKKRKP